METIGACKVNGDVAVRVGGRVVLKDDGRPIKRQVRSSSKMSAGIAPAGAGAKVKFQPSTRVVVERCFRVLV